MTHKSRKFLLQTFVQICRAIIGEILQKSRARLPATHRDTNDIDICPIPLVIIANKFDLFANEDPAKRRVLMSALRFVAHTSGASLYCCSAKDKKLSAHYRSMMNIA